MEHIEEQSTTTPAHIANTPAEKESPAAVVTSGKAPKHFLHTKKLNNLFAHNREVVLYVANDERSTVEAISDSVSTYGYTPAEFTSGEHSLRDIIFPDDLQTVTDYVNNQLGQGAKSFDFDFRIVSKQDSLPVWTTCAILPEYNQAGQAIHFLVKIKDISRQVQNEQKLIAEKNCLQVLGDYFPNGCLFRMVIDNDAKNVTFSYLSRTWEKMTNTSIRDSLQDIGVPFAKVHPDDLKHLMESIWSPPGILDNFDSEIRYFYANNDMRWFQVSTHRHSENGQLLLDGFIFDITDRKRAEAAFGLYQDELERLVKERTEELEDANRELYNTNMELLNSYKELEKYQTQLEEMVASKTIELIHAKEKAEESDKLKSAFLANMSHEIRTPLNGIVGFLNFLTSDNLSLRRKEDYINVIRNSSMQLVKLIDDIIDLAKIEARQMSISPVPLRINELMRELQVFFETFLQSKNKHHIAMVLDESGFVDSCVTFVDPLRLRQTLSNLISNAIKFTEKGYIRFGYRLLSPNMLEFVVEDTGIGLAADRLDVIFERFRQAEASTNPRYGGTGLGLTISKNLVQLMGGDIRVESIEGVGSTFYFTISYIPVDSEDDGFFDEMPGTDSPGKFFEDKVVLLVEPEIMKRRYYERLFTATGVSVIHADNMQQWLDCIDQGTHLDAVVADIKVFDAAGNESSRLIKAVCAGLPIIMLVPQPVEKYRLLIRESQCNLALEEPLSYNELLKVLVRYIRQKKHSSGKATTP